MLRGRKEAPRLLRSYRDILLDVTARYLKPCLKGLPHLLSWKLSGRKLILSLLPKGATKALSVTFNIVPSDSGVTIAKAVCLGGQGSPSSVTFFGCRSIRINFPHIHGGECLWGKVTANVAHCLISLQTAFSALDHLVPPIPKMVLIFLVD